MINQENGYAIAHRINAATTGALKRAFISSQGQRLAAFRYGAHQNVEQFLEDHEDIVPVRGDKNSVTEAHHRGTETRNSKSRPAANEYESKEAELPCINADRFRSADIQDAGRYKR